MEDEDYEEDNEDGPVLGMAYQIFSCHVCNKNFHKLSSLDLHKVRVHNEETSEKIYKQHKCDICDKVFYQSSHLKRHQKIHYKPGKSADCVEGGPDQEEMTEKTVYSCTLCNEVFKEKSMFIDHSLAVHSMTEDDDVVVSTVPQFQCEVCNKMLESISSLKRHLYTHTGEKSVVCDVCGKVLKDRGSLRQHRVQHEDRQPFPCDICKKGFQSKSHLIRHQRTHTGEKVSFCEICGKGFSENRNLARHLLSHSGLKLVKCTECERSFASKAEMEVHKKTHTDDKAYTCDICEKTFRQPAGLVNHRKTHLLEKPYKCDDCKYSTAFKADLKKHQNKHTAIKLYKCDVCSKTFTLVTSLRSHRLSHEANTTRKTYPCQYCSAEFTRTNHLNRHLNKEHVEEVASSGVEVGKHAQMTLISPQKVQTPHGGQKFLINFSDRSEKVQSGQTADKNSSTEAEDGITRPLVRQKVLTQSVRLLEEGFFAVHSEDENVSVHPTSQDVNPEEESEHHLTSQSELGVQQQESGELIQPIIMYVEEAGGGYQSILMQVEDDQGELMEVINKS